MASKITTIDELMKFVESVKSGSRAPIVLDDSRASIGKELAALGLRPYFWDDRSIGLIGEILGTHSVAKHMLMAKSPYSLWKPVNVKPIPADDATREADKIGFFLMAPEQVAIRSNIQNVKSCHRVPNGEFSFGNFGYLMNPAWCTFAFYQESNAKASIQDPTTLSSSKDGEILNGMPNVLATCNVCLGFEENGTAVAMISRVYGNRNTDMTRLIEYLTVKLGLGVGFIQSNTPDVWSAILNIAKYRNKAQETNDLGTFKAIGLPAQFWWDVDKIVGPSVDNLGAALPMRYQDIAPPTTSVHGGVIYVGEKLSGTLVRDGEGQAILTWTALPHSTKSLYPDTEPFRLKPSVWATINTRDLRLKSTQPAPTSCPNCGAKFGRDVKPQSTIDGIYCTRCAPTLVDCGEYGVCVSARAANYIDEEGKRHLVPIRLLHGVGLSTITGGLVKRPEWPESEMVYTHPDQAKAFRIAMLSRDYLQAYTDSVRWNTYSFLSDDLERPEGLRLLAPKTSDGRPGYVLCKNIPELWRLPGNHRVDLCATLGIDQTLYTAYLEALFPEYAPPKPEVKLGTVQTRAGNYYTYNADGVEELAAELADVVPEEPSLFEEEQQALVAAHLEDLDYTAPIDADLLRAFGADMEAPTAG